MKHAGGNADPLAWAKSPPPRGASGSMWERTIIELAEAGDSRFVEILRRHVASGLIKAKRAVDALEFEVAA